MADRRTDETQPAPRRTLTGPAPAETDEAPSAPASTRRPLAERLSAAVSGASGSSRGAAGGSVGGSTSGAVSGATVAERSGSGRESDGTSTSTSVGNRPATTSGSTPVAPPRPPTTRRARLRLTHVDPWSVMKTAFLLSIAFGIVTVVAVALVWSVLSSAGVWESINKTVTGVLGSDAAATFNVEDYVGTSRVLGFTMIVAAVDVVLLTAIATLGAFLYNLAAALLGGLEVTLAEDNR